MGKILIIISLLTFNFCVLAEDGAVDGSYNIFPSEQVDKKTELTPELMQEILERFGTKNEPEEEYYQINGKFYSAKEFALIKAQLDAEGKTKKETPMKEFLEMFMKELGNTGESISEFFKQRQEREMRRLQEQQSQDFNMYNNGANRAPVTIEGINPAVQQYMNE